MSYIDDNPTDELIDELKKDVPENRIYNNDRMEIIQNNMPVELLILSEKMNATFKPKLVVVWERES